MQISPTPLPVESHGDVLAVSWRKVFTGRVAELRLLGDLMLSGERGCFVVWLHGMAGVGKSTLLRRFAEEAEAHGRVTRSVDLRHAAPTPEAFLAALEAQGAPEDAQVLLIDSAESLGPLEQWLRDVFLPGMPSRPLLVVGGRLPPSAEWRTDPQWWHALRSVELTGMDEAEAALLLRNRFVDEAEVPGIVRAAHGLPLALALFADARERATGPVEQRRLWELRDSPDLVRELLSDAARERVAVPGRCPPRAGAGLVTTEESVRHALEVPPARAHALFTWLRSLSFVRSTAEGLVPHELMREALLADLRWRGPEKYESLFGRLHGQLTERLGQRAGDRWASGAGLAYLGRTNQLAREAVDWRGADRIRLRAARPEDLDQAVAAIEKEHGVAAGALALRWWEHQPTAFTVAEDGRRFVGVLVAPAWIRAPPGCRTIRWRALP